MQPRRRQDCRLGAVRKKMIDRLIPIREGISIWQPIGQAKDLADCRGNPLGQSPGRILSTGREVSNQLRELPRKTIR
jgi:hypothetical protein